MKLALALAVCTVFGLATAQAASRQKQMPVLLPLLTQTMPAPRPDIMQFVQTVPYVRGVEPTCRSAAWYFDADWPDRLATECDRDYRAGVGQEWLFTLTSVLRQIDGRTP